MRKNKLLFCSTFLSVLLASCVVNTNQPNVSSSDTLSSDETEELSSTPIDVSSESVESSTSLNSSEIESSEPTVEPSESEPETPSASEPEQPSESSESEPEAPTDTSSESAVEPSESESTMEPSDSEPEVPPSYDVIPTTVYTLDLDEVAQVYSQGETLVVNASTWTNYIVIDIQGRIVYTVGNVGCGYGNDSLFYSHPLYQSEVHTYFEGTDFVVPVGCTGYSVSYAEYGRFMNEVSGGNIPESEIEAAGYGENVRNWNSFNNAYLNMYSGVRFEGYMVDDSFDFSAFGVGYPTVEEKAALPNYTPTTFSTSSYSTKKTALGDGVDLYVATYKLNNGSTVKPHAIVVDLTKANIVAGTTNDSVDPTTYYTKGKPYSHATAYEDNHPGVKVLAATNADFFGTLPVNAFVKDGVILKAAHNSDVGDVPVSKPMLFGVSKAGARIGPMTNLSNYADNQNAALTTTGVSLAGADGSKKGTFAYSLDSRPSDTAISIITKLNVSKSLSEGSKVYKFKKIQQDQSTNGEMRACIVERENVTKVRVTDERYGYLVLGPKFKEATMQVGDYLVTNDSVYSKGGMWDYYDTIIGARHSLVENGVLPSTLSNESQNGAKSRVPRTAVGVMSDGKVVIVSVEDIHYGGHSSTCTGLTLTQLADFMRYFGCYDAANFDGGGSTQLIAREGYNGSGAFTVRTKSSDTNSTSVSSTRSVVNSILVTTKK